MKYKKLNIEWNAEPNAPLPELSVDGSQIRIKFFLDSFLNDYLEDDEMGELIFVNCHKYSFNNCNDEAYYRSKYRYNNSQLPWGEFYELQTEWRNDFPQDGIVLNESVDESILKHFIFFLRDNTFECVAEKYEFSYLKDRTTQVQQNFSACARQCLTQYKVCSLSESTLLSWEWSSW